LFKLPTLKEVFDLVGRKLVVNVEIKVPYSSAVKKRYNWQAACQTVFELVRSEELFDYAFVSSFDYDAL
jgi:glycerophosphoryl diester phosphodiesterase